MKQQKRRGSVLFTSLILLTIAAVGVMGLVRYITSAQQAAIRDRDYFTAFYAAESGVERVVDYFNNPTNYTGTVPDAYDDYQSHPAAFASSAPFAPQTYEVFQPYVVSYLLDSDGALVYGANNQPVILSETYFRDPNAGDAEAVSRTSKIPTIQFDMDEVEGIQFFSDNGEEVAWVNSILFENPNDLADLAAITANNRLVIGKVTATGTTRKGLTVKVESIITENNASNFRSPAAILSEQAIAFNGQFNVQWGEIWCNQVNIDLPTNWQQSVPKYGPTFRLASGNNDTEDPWFGMRTEKYIVNSKGQYANGITVTTDRRGRLSWTYQFTNNPPLAGTKNFTRPFFDPIVDDYKNFYQNQDLDWPEYDWEEWRNFVKEYGFPYYYTDENGNIYGTDRDPDSSTYGQIVSKTYDQWFNAQDPSDPDYWKLENIIVFIDGVPQNDAGETSTVINSEFYPRDPSAPGTIRPTIQLAGGGLHTRGVMLISPNMKMTGQGNTGVTGDEIPVEAGGGFRMPNNTVYADADDVNVFHNGLMYSWGSLDLGGNRTIYGSVFAEQGYGQGGSPSVWYNARMRDGAWINLNLSRVRRDLWNISKD